MFQCKNGWIPAEDEQLMELRLRCIRDAGLTGIIYHANGIKQYKFIE